MVLYTYGPIAPAFRQYLGEILQAAGAAWELRVAPLPRDLVAILSEWDAGHLEIFVWDRMNPRHRRDSRILLSTGEDPRFRAWCLTECSSAHWGCSGGFIAVDFAPTKHRLENQLHEVLHVFGAEDCYDRVTLEPLPSCTDTRCNMRYENPSTVVCSTVLEQLERSYNRWLSSGHS